MKPLLCTLLCVLPALAAPARALAPLQDPRPAPSEEGAAAGEAAAEGDAAELDVDLKDVTDQAIRWLRARQDESGSYGGSVESTAWVLQALALSPRHYTRADGPFVRRALDFLASRIDDEGRVHDPDVTGDRAFQQHVLALLAVARYDDPESRALRERLEAGLATPLRIPEAEVPSREEALASAREWLAKRRPDGSWNGEEGPIIETARAVIELSRCYPVLRSKSAPRAVRALPPFEAADREAALAAIERGVRFLAAIAPDGRFGAPGRPDAGLTAMALAAMQTLPEPRPEEIQRVIDRGLEWLVSLQDRDGSIHDGKLKNYITSAAILALVKSGKPEYRPVIERARRFLLALQADEGEGYSEGDLYYGGIGYGGDERPDLSNLQMALEALAASGSKPGDEVFTRALRFLERTQNRSESNDVRLERDGKVIVSGDDGGAAYAPGESKAGYIDLPDGTRVPRSYGSMTYALLKGFLFAGLPKDDPRMQAAWKWVREHYTLDVNPGFESQPDPSAGYQGLFYYLLAMARALDLYGEEVVVDGEGTEHPWRRELAGRLISMQRKDDGSWINENSSRWWEGNPILATSYALLALEAALPTEDGEAAR